MPIYAYADETIFDIAPTAGIHALGYGIFISKTPITQDVIQEAIEELRNDPDFDKRKDGITVSNGYFHASDDSANAHSHFCNAIRRNVKGIFEFSYFTIGEGEQLTKNQKEKFFNSSLIGASTEFFNSLEEVYLTIEGRTELSDDYMNKWRERIYEIFEGACYETPFYKTYFPKINIEIGDKNNPGLQVADFISWATARTFRQPESLKWKVWFQRLQFLMSSVETTEGMKQKGCKAYLNDQPDRWSLDYPQKFEESQSYEDVRNAYALIERFIRNIDKLDFRPENMHLYDDFRKAQQHCVSLKPLQNDDLRFIARVYISLFDSLPIYSQITDDDLDSWRLLFHTKEIAALLIRDGQLHMGMTQDYIQRWRYEAIKNDLQGFLVFVQAV